MVGSFIRLLWLIKWGFIDKKKLNFRFIELKIKWRFWIYNFYKSEGRNEKW